MANFLELSIFFYLSFLSGFLNLLLLLLDANLNEFSYWPPPKKNSWQYYTIWFLFILFSGSFMILIFTEVNRRNDNIFLFYFGIALSTIGLFFANFITIILGLKNASGLKKRLVIKGWYSLSRNPVYVATYIALIGVVIFLPILEVIILSFFWAFAYKVAIRLEEAWLEKQYGKEYLDYKRIVPRFIGRRLK